jgi:outer membrane protein assembly factor BamA
MRRRSTSRSYSLPSAILLFVALPCFAPLFAQTPTAPDADTNLGTVDTVIVEGNDKTLDYVILDEMTLKIGSRVTPEAIEYDKRRIYSLGLFTRVDILYDTLTTLRALVVEVREQWYLIPFFGFRDGDPKKPYYGAGLLHNNFRGRNQKLYGMVVLGHDPSFAFEFGDPLFDRPHSLFVAGSFSFSRIRNRSIVESSLTGDFDEYHTDVNGTIGKRFSLFASASVNAGVHSVKVSSYRQGRTASLHGHDIYLYTTLRYDYDSRDLREYATRGVFLNGTFTKNGFGEGPVDFSRFGADARVYVPFTETLSLATRVFGTFVSGTLIPTYAHAYFGTYERIRGYYQTIWEGENLAGGTIELRQVLIKTLTFTIPSLPIPQEFAVWRFGLSLALFTDTGAAWYRHDRVNLHSFVAGYGVGLHFLLPYTFVLRTESAWNDLGKQQFIIDLRTSI